MQPQWIKKFLILILLSIMLVGCAKESSEADPNIIDLPEQSGGSVPDTDFAMFINQAVSQSDPSPSEEIFFRIVFSREINPATFTTLDLNNLGTSTGALFVITPSADNKIFEVSTNSIATEGTVVLEIPTGAIQDTYGNSNLVNTGIDNSINYSTDLNVIIDQKLGQDDPAGNLPIEFDVNFTSAINDSTFLLDDISLDAASLATTVVVAGETAGPASGVSEPQPLSPKLKAGILNSRKVMARFMAKVSLSVQSR